MKTTNNQPLPKGVKTTYERHGRDFYKRIGSIGGHNGHTGGFQEGSDKTKEAGRKGGLKSRRSFYYNYKFTQLVELTPKTFIDFTREHQKYTSFQADYNSQKKNHTIHPLTNLPKTVTVPVFYVTEEGFTYTLLAVNGKIRDPFNWLKNIKLCNQHVIEKSWAEYYRGIRIIKKEKI